MKRRQLLCGIASLALVRAVAAQAPRGLPVVGLFSTGPELEDLEQYYVGPFVDEMRRRFGWRENVNIVYRRAYNVRRLRMPENLSSMHKEAQKLIDTKPDVIWVDSSTSAEVITKHTSDIPVVGSAVSDVVRRGFAISLAQPGRNFTGISNVSPPNLGAKRLEFLIDLMPRLARVGVLVLRGNRSSLAERDDVVDYAMKRRISAFPVEIGKEEEAEAAFSEFAKERVQAVLITHQPVFQNHRKSLIRLAQTQKIPVVGTRTYFVIDGALLSYSTYLDKQMRTSAGPVHQILKGAAPGGIAIQVLDDMELAINRGVAKEFGLPIPDTLLAREKNIRII